jgi:hypothetical protein
MTQQEIFQNMTKLPWFWHVQGSKLILTGEFAEMKVATMNVEVDDHTNVKAIESAVNNTYGKGINPESVEKMRTYIQYEYELYENGFFVHEGKEYRYAKETADLLHKLRAKALTAAKL